MVGLAYALSGNASGAEDIAQEAFLAAHRRWDRVSELEAPGAWVRRVVANISVSWFRRKTSEARAMTRLGARLPSRVEEIAGADAEFGVALRALPRRQAQALALHYLEDMPVAEIAHVLEIAEGTVKALLHKGRASLARKLDAEEVAAR